MHQPLISIATHTTPAPPLRNLRFDAPIARLPLPDDAMILATCADGALLACRYMTVGEFSAQLRQNALLATCLELKLRSQWAYLLLDGVFAPMASGKTLINDRPSGYEFSAIQGALLTIQEAGVGVVYVRSETYLADCIYILAKRDRGEKRVRPARNVLFTTPGEDLLMALPGIGEAAKDALLSHVGSFGAGAALDALTDLSTTPPGITAKQQAEARKALALPAGVRLGWIDDHAPSAVPTNLQIVSTDHDRTSTIISINHDDHAVAA